MAGEQSIKRVLARGDAGGRSRGRFGGPEIRSKASRGLIAVE